MACGCDEAADAVDVIVPKDEKKPADGEEGVVKRGLKRKRGDLLRRAVWAMRCYK